MKGKRDMMGRLLEKGRDRDRDREIEIEVKVGR